MKSLFSLLICLISISILTAQSENEMMKKTDSADTLNLVESNNMACCSGCKYKPLLTAGGRYYFNTLENTRNTLAANGFILEQEAVEYFISFGKLPKLYYFQQLGDLRGGNYASVTGFGLKKDFGYNIFKNSDFILRPYAEIGAGYFRMNIAKNVTGNSISTVLNSTVENYFLDNFVFTGDVGLSLGYGFKVDNSKVNIMVNGGFTGNIPTEWKLAQSLAFREKIQLGSPYAGATIRLDLCDCCK